MFITNIFAEQESNIKMATFMQKHSEKARNICLENIEHETPNEKANIFKNTDFNADNNDDNDNNNDVIQEIDFSKLRFNFDDLQSVKPNGSRLNNNQTLCDYVRMHSSILSSNDNCSSTAPNCISNNITHHLLSDDCRPEYRKIPQLLKEQRLSYSEAIQKNNIHENLALEKWKMANIGNITMFSPYILPRQNGTNGKNNSSMNIVQEQQAFARLSARIRSSTTSQSTEKSNNNDIESRSLFSPDSIKRLSNSQSSFLKQYMDTTIGRASKDTATTKAIRSSADKKLSFSSKKNHHQHHSVVPLMTAIPKNSVLYQCLVASDVPQETCAAANLSAKGAYSPELKINLEDVKDTRKGSSGICCLASDSASLTSIPRTSVLHQIYKRTKSNVTMESKSSEVSSPSDERLCRLTTRRSIPNIYESVQNQNFRTNNSIISTSFDANEKKSFEYNIKQGLINCAKPFENESVFQTDYLDINSVNSFRDSTASQSTVAVEQPYQSILKNLSNDNCEMIKTTVTTIQSILHDDCINENSKIFSVNEPQNRSIRSLTDSSKTDGKWSENIETFKNSHCFFQSSQETAFEYPPFSTVKSSDNASQRLVLFNISSGI